MYKLILIPEGAVLPEDLQHMFRAGDDLIQKIYAGSDSEVIISVNTRELQMIVEYRDLFDAETTAIIGLQGAMYNTIWNTYVATMDRTTVDAMRVSLRESNDTSAQIGSSAVARPTRAARALRAAPDQTERQDDDTPDEASYT